MREVRFHLNALRRHRVVDRHLRADFELTRHVGIRIAGNLPTLKGESSGSIGAQRELFPGNLRETLKRPLEREMEDDWPQFGLPGWVRCESRLLPVLFPLSNFLTIFPV
jgi:hypothetical protein